MPEMTVLGADIRDFYVENSDVIKDTGTVREDTLAFHCSAADNCHSRSLLSEDELYVYTTRHHDQRDNDVMSVDHDSSRLSENFARNEIDNSSFYDSQNHQWEGQTVKSAGESGEGCNNTAEHSERNAKQGSISPMAVTVTADVDPSLPQSPLLSPPLYSDTSFAGEDNEEHSQLSGAEEESSEDFEQVGDLGPVAQLSLAISQLTHVSTLMYHVTCHWHDDLTELTDG